MGGVARSARLVAAAAVAAAGLLGVPATAAPVANPPKNVTPSPSYTSACAHYHSNSAACVSRALAAINRARTFEHVRPMVLPRNFTTLTFAEQTFVVSDLERVDRGLAPFRGITATYNRTAAAAAKSGVDPAPATATIGGFVGTTYGSNWSANFGPLAADYGWMYFDGYGNGNYNVDCTSPSASGCWAHRRVILDKYDDKPMLVSGAGSDKQNGLVSIAQMFVAGSGKAPAFTYTWADALRHGADARK